MSIRARLPPPRTEATVMKVLRGLFYAFLIAVGIMLVTSLIAPQSAPANWLKAEMAPIMFGSLVVFLLLGYPVAFSLRDRKSVV